MDAANFFLGFEGRIGRMWYWIGSIVVMVISTAIQWMLGVPLTGDTTDPQLRIIECVIDLISIYPIAALSVKRMHDRGRPGIYVWLLVAALAAVTLVNFFGYLDQGAEISFVIWIVILAAFVIGLAFLIELGFRRGIPGPNEYGPEPS